MKIIFLVLIFYVFINSISAFLWFNHRPKEQEKQITKSSTTHHFQRLTFEQQKQSRNSTSLLRQAIISSTKNNTNTLSGQRFINRQQYQVRNTGVIQRQADSLNKKSSQIIPQNRFQAIAYQQQSLNYRQANRVIYNTNSPIAYRRFRPSLSTGKNNAAVGNSANRRVFPSFSLTKAVVADSKGKNSSNIQSFQSRSAFGKAITPSKKTGLLRVLSTKVVNNDGYQDRRRLMADFYYQQRLKEFYRRINEDNPARTHSNKNLVMRQRKRQYEEKSIPPNNYIGMVLVRDSYIKDRDTN